MIKGTNADCKILKVSISESVATLTLLIFATKATNPSKSFKVYLKDEDKSTLEEIDPNIYWIDQINNYNFDSTNIDTKKYKEIMINIDISRKNTASIQGNKWVRNCYIMLLDTAKAMSTAIAWSSSLLTLISDEFEIPEITNISMSTKNVRNYILDQNNPEKTEPRGQIQTTFKLKYTSERDFNYNNQNFKAYMKIRSVSSDEVIETREIAQSTVSLENTILSNERYSFSVPVVVQIVITNKNGEIMRDYRKIYKPYKKYSNTYIKTENGTKKALTFFVNTDQNTEHEGAFNKISANVIKVNYNNAAVKKPYEIVPSIICYRVTLIENDVPKNYLVIEIDAKLNQESFYNDFIFEVFIDDVLYSYVNKNTPTNEAGRYVIMLGDTPLFSLDALSVQIKGKYGDEFSNERNFVNNIVYIYNQMTPNDDLYCDEILVCNDTLYGYLVDNLFYTERYGNQGEYIYDGIIDPDTFNGDFVDIDTREIYKWNSNSNEYQLI